MAGIQKKANNKESVKKHPQQAYTRAQDLKDVSLGLKVIPYNYSAYLLIGAIYWHHCLITYKVDTIFSRKAEQLVFSWNNRANKLLYVNVLASYMC